MRPLRLTISAFGPFPGRETIPFEALPKSAIVLIHGPTGSGKTSILDAICFALYGKSSGDEREARDVRSAEAKRRAQDDPSAHQLTRVVLDFEVGNQRYRVLREPEQERPKLRSKTGGMTKHSHRAVLWRIPEDQSDEGSTNGEEDDPPAGTPCEAEGPADVADAISRLLGFDAGQFRQVVVLPQGKFRELLTASSKEREAILERLFASHVYQRISVDLAERTAGLRKSLEMLEHDGQQILEALECADRNALAELIEAQSSALATMLEEERTLVSASQADERAVERANQRRDAHQLLRSANDRVLALQARHDEMDRRKKRLDLARQCEPLLPLRGRLHRATSQLKARHIELQTTSSQLAELEHEWRLAEERHSQAVANEPHRQELQQEIAKLQQLTPAVSKFAELQRETNDLAAKLGAFEASLDTIEKEKSNLERMLLGHQEVVERLAGASALVEKENHAVTQAERAVHFSEARDQASQQVSEAQQAFLMTQEQEATAKSERDALRSAFDHLDKRFRSGQAQLLARELVPGAPCPVCGSLDHGGAQAQLGLGLDVPTVEAHEAAQRAVDVATSTVEQRVRETADASQVLQAAQASLDLALQGLDGTGVARDLSQQDCQARHKLSLMRLREAKDNARRLEAAQQEVKRITPLLTSIASRLQGNAASRDTIRLQLERAQASLQAAMTSIGDGPKTPQALEHALSGLNSRLTSSVDALKAAAEHEKKTHAELRGAQTTLSTLKQEYERETQEKEAADLAFQQACATADLTSPETFSAAAADVPQISALESALEAFRTERAAAQAQLEQARDAAQGLEPLAVGELEALAEAAKASAAALSDFQQAVGSTRQRLFQLQGDAERYDSYGDRAERAREAYTLARGLSDLALGRVREAGKISFARFVLSALLDDVLAQANLRLLKLSRGRYELLRQRDGGSRAASGLDLLVLDAFNGLERPAHTLSGGESFLAALALSLGLSDVVQRYSGGIHLDALFIDEGFGTLDPEALDRAVDMLASVHAYDGHNARLVGIITHVPELKERLSTRIAVHPTTSGSTLEMQFPPTV